MIEKEKKTAIDCKHKKPEILPNIFKRRKIESSNKVYVKAKPI